MTYEVLSTLTGQQVNKLSEVIIRGWQNTHPFMTGCQLKTKDVFSICYGTVVEIGKDKNNLYSVSVEYNYSTWIRYCSLHTCCVSLGDTIAQHTKIGEANKNCLRFEYCSDEISEFPLRTSNRQLYKHDPMPVLLGDIELPDPEPEVYVVNEDKVNGNEG